MLRLLSLRGRWRPWPSGGGSTNWARGERSSSLSGLWEIEDGRFPRHRLLETKSGDASALQECRGDIGFGSDRIDSGWTGVQQGSGERSVGL